MVHQRLPRPATLLLAALLALPAILGATPTMRTAEAGAPPLSDYHRDKVHKFSFKMLRGYVPVPLKTDEKTYLCKFSDPKGKGSARGTFDPEIAVLRIVHDDSDKPVTTGGGETPQDPRAQWRERMRRLNKPKDVWDATLTRLRLSRASTKDKDPLDKRKKGLDKRREDLRERQREFDIRKRELDKREKDPAKLKKALDDLNKEFDDVNNFNKEFDEVDKKLDARLKKKLDKIKRKFKELKSKDKPSIPGKLWQFEVGIQSGYQGRPAIALHVTIAEFRREATSLVIYMTCGGKLGKAYASAFKGIAKSFKWFDKKAKDVERINDLDGVNITAKKRSEIERGMIKGWDVVVSPNKNYIIIYNTKEGKNTLLAKVIAKRIEAIRAQVYEKQFPPAKPITTVCIVRVCKDKPEYHKYGGPGGSAGYWSPMDEELVFYDASASKKPDDDTLAVLYHEAFHQYIHYSVGRVAPHSWFNEGHGDYYAGAKYKSGKFKIGPFRWRVGVVKGAIVQGPKSFTMVKGRDGKMRKVWKGYTALKELVAFTQAQYYSYPSVSYAQGWSLIYFLREIVPKNKKYNAKWGHILDTYFDTLKAEVNRGSPLVRGGEGTPEDGDEGDSGGDEGEDTPAPPTRPDTPAPEEDEVDPTPEDGGDAGDGDEGGDGDEKPKGPPPQMAPPPPRGRGGSGPLKKALDAAFKGIDWDEFQAAWLKATKKGK